MLDLASMHTPVRLFYLKVPRKEKVGSRETREPSSQALPSPALAASEENRRGSWNICWESHRCLTQSWCSKSQACGPTCAGLWPLSCWIWALRSGA